eukprot:gnl/TRDRNA2_/TRDRNA2_159747_c2_seq1.p1 gnl/TRDRNA2_/TRDRNA2_159747_c2~~gnl/TRDRNA2_/TRDRNA2_159747_c2_seq1.p1  ORF type:complete len:250 (+),score=15.77 gnl/TRDRNA2_/TRDRNA2_159747_c2_seq1:57-806(+)
MAFSCDAIASERVCNILLALKMAAVPSWGAVRRQCAYRAQWSRLKWALPTMVLMSYKWPLSMAETAVHNQSDPANPRVNSTHVQTTPSAWELQTDAAKWDPRVTMAEVVGNGTVLVVAGHFEDGVNWTYSFNDVWKSDDLGATWMLQTAGAEFGMRKRHALAALQNGSILVLGGQKCSADWQRLDTGCELCQDVWRSDDMGRSWLAVEAVPAWSARKDAAAVTLLDGGILMIGGSDSFAFDAAYRRRWQ